MPTLITPDKRSLVIPWLDYASTSVPDNHEVVLWWSQYLWLTDGTYRSAMRRVLSHFLTDLEFPELDPDEENEYRELFQGPLNWRRELKACGDDFLSYGILVVQLHLPFHRYLCCNECHKEFRIERIPYRVELRSSCPENESPVVWHKTKPCPCGSRHPWKLRDRIDPDMDRVRLRRYSPFDIKIAYNPHSKVREVYWRISAQEAQDIRSGARIFIDTTPVEILEAVATTGVLRLHDDAVLVCTEDTISGIRNAGWGMPRLMGAWRAAWLRQQTQRADQAIVSDYTLGMRFISPAPTAGGMDPTQMDSMEEWRANMEGMIARSRANQTFIHTLPYAVQYQFAGGEGANLLPPEKLKFRDQELLNQLDVPVAYYTMDLTTQAAPLALQLFESAWSDIPDLYNQVLGWTTGQVAKHYGKTETKVVMRPSTIAYDETRKQLLTQLMSANQVSPATALAPFGINAYDEVQKVFRHQDLVARTQQRHQEEQQQEQEMGAMGQLAAAPSPSAALQAKQAPPPGTPMGGLPGGGAGGQPANDIMAIMEQAQQMAQQLISMPELDRKRQLRAIKQSNPTLHSQVKQYLEEMRQQAGSQAVQQMQQPQPGGGAPPQG